MMKKSFLVLVGCCIAVLASANSVHWITFVDTTDPNVGAVDVNGRKFLYSQWINKVSAALTSEGYTQKVHDYYGSSTTPDNCKQVIQDFRCGSNDIVVFYYIGHGGRSIADKSKYPQMLLAQTYENKCVPLTWVHNKLKASGARLVITIGMCCNSFDPSLTPKETIAFHQNNGTAAYSVSEMEAIRKIFLENVGDIIISSSSVGQSSWAFEIPGMNAPMDIFTFRFITDFNTYMRETATPSWHTLIGRVTTDVNNLSLSRARVAQTPQYDINVVKTDRPNKSQKKETPLPIVSPQQDREIAQIETSTDEISQAVTAVLDNIIDPNEKLETRMRRAGKLKSRFTSDAVVKTIAEDSKTVVDKMPVSDFFDIAATSDTYYKIIVLSTKADVKGQFTELRVREYVKK